MKNLMKIFVVVAGIATTLYACEPKNTETTSAPDSTASETAPAPDPVDVPADTAATAPEDTAGAAN